MRSTRRVPNSGFLLAETLITFALSALVLVGLVTATATLLRATDRSVAVAGAGDDLGRTLAALARDLSQMKRARWAGDEPQGFVFKGASNSLFFVEDAREAGGGTRRVVSLREINVRGGTALMRAYARLPATAAGWSELRFGPPEPVPTGPARLRFRYLAEAPVDGAATPHPTDGWPFGGTLPAAVIVEAVDAATKRSLVTERIDVLADADVGCADRSNRDKEAGGSSGAPEASGLNSAPVLPSATGPTVANPNEFCGRADGGVPPSRTASSASAPIAPPQGRLP